MSYPYTNQGVERADSKLGFRTGRILFVEDPAKFTPREFLQFIKEGFVPVMAEAVTNEAEPTEGEDSTPTKAIQSDSSSQNTLEGFCYRFLCWDNEAAPQADGSIEYTYSIRDGSTNYVSTDLDLAYGRYSLQ